jgi:hypothetical protein
MLWGQIQYHIYERLMCHGVLFVDVIRFDSTDESYLLETFYNGQTHFLQSRCITCVLHKLIQADAMQ